MPGFRSDGTIASSQNAAPHVVFCLKSSAGAELKTYSVPVSEADSFEAKVRAEEPKLREEAGEKEPLSLIRISRAF